MISYINIKNIALIRELSIELYDGLNILSGETGAGKSIIIDSINFVLGDRADRSLIRFGETTARVEVVFDNIINFDEIKSELIANGIDCDDETLIVARTMTSEKSECRINGRIVTLSFLRNIVGSLVDIHSQNEHQSLMKPANHIYLLDALNDKIAAKVDEYRISLAKYKDLKEQIASFMSEEERERRIDMLNYQIEEIERLDWTDPDEENRLKIERNRYYNSQKIIESLTSCANSLSDDNMGALYSIKNAMSEMRAAVKYDETLNEIYDRIDSLAIEAEDISDTLREKLYEYGDSINIDAIEARIDELKLLKKKYGQSIEEVGDFLINAKEEAEKLADAERLIGKMTAEIEELESDIEEKVREIHILRVSTAEKFAKSICNNLKELGMKNSVFDVKIDYPDDVLDNLHQNGADTVEFMLSPNLGEPLKPLSKIASGGEASRFMLALKNIIAEVDKIGTLIFDEIDTGISGVIAKVVACKLYDIARSRQVIAITHLPQLASMADNNYLIQKSVVGEKTVTSVTHLEGDDVYTEIMRLTGALENSAVGLSGAKELKNWANSYKNK